MIVFAQSGYKHFLDPQLEAKIQIISSKSIIKNALQELSSQKKEQSYALER